ncbi:MULTISPECIES: DUF885 domain-containing protein [unclassified Microbacterium]|uniref:DUF885 domain-containing protein n=1 Tax=unclassified Microbacterium TaxID=2609290 RepID=UPI00214BDDE4|nr:MULTISPECIES: DUF885 domain-containing protein [unclassified Microbacterium]MCR2810817.1 DUF885 domain-containing protein [Microbacterium sp. zg.B185]WIM19776.1 DUF885 domain-containing protein [Microbacterium sp. zg-B185]
MNRAADSVRRIADQYVAELAAHEPDAAQAAGLASPGPLADIGPEWLQRKYALQGEVLAALDALPGTAGEDPLRAALAERLERERLLFDTGFTPRLVAGLASPVHLIRYAIEGLTVTADAAGADLVARLEAVPDGIAQYIASLRWAASNAERFTGTGIAPVRQLDTLTAQIELWLSADWFGSLPIDDPVDAATRGRVRAAADAANAALGQLLAVLREELRPLAPTVDGVGVQVYADLAAAMLGARIDLADTYAYGWAELTRLVAEARALAASLGGTGADPVRGAAKLLDADPGYRLEGVDAIRSWLERRVDETIGALEPAFDLPSGIRNVECVVAEASTGVVYYTPAPPDGSVPSRIVWTIPSGVPVAATWQEVTSVHHEGLPGHHLQFAVTASSSDLHPWQRHLCHIHGYAEGWAHYAEQLADELGLVRDPAERLGLLLGQIWRSVRIVADIGLHTGWAIPANSLVAETEWSPQLAQRMLVELALVEPHLAGFEVDRYLGWPGQALAFKIGARLWHDARAEKAAAQGDAFSLRAFHRDALALGPMGLEPLRAQLLAG